jgi:hypothetical protein
MPGILALLPTSGRRAHRILPGGSPARIRPVVDPLPMTENHDRDDLSPTRPLSPAQPSGERRRVRPGRLRTLGVAAAVAGLVVGGATVTAFAAGGDEPASAGPGASATPGASAGPGEGGGPGKDGYGRHRGRGPLAGLGRAGLGPPLHGELVVPKKDGGGTQTVVVQTGEVTAVSESSIAVRSSDGFTATYQVTSATRVGRQGGTITSVEKGATVRVAGTKDGSTLTALLVGHGGPGHGGPGDGGSPTPAPEPPLSRRRRPGPGRRCCWGYPAGRRCHGRSVPRRPRTRSAARRSRLPRCPEVAG